MPGFDVRDWFPSSNRKDKLFPFLSWHDDCYDKNNTQKCLAYCTITRSTWYYPLRYPCTERQKWCNNVWDLHKINNNQSRASGGCWTIRYCIFIFYIYNKLQCCNWFIGPWAIYRKPWKYYSPICYQYHQHFHGNCMMDPWWIASQHWFRKRLSAAGKEAIAWPKTGLVPCCLLVSLGANTLTNPIYSLCG